MDELGCFFALEARLLERTSTNLEPFEFGIAYLDEEHPERYYTSFLRVDARREGLTAEGLAAAAERILGHPRFVHRMVVVNDERVAEELTPRFEQLGYRTSWSVVMSNRRPPDRAGEVPVREVPFAEVRALIRETYLEDEGVPDALADGFTQQQGKREGTIGARSFVADVDDEHAGSCELYVDGSDAQVEHVGTLERYRGRGVARSVVLRAVDEARLAGASRIFIVADEDDWPKRLYERLGFDRIGRIGDFLALKGP